MALYVYRVSDGFLASYSQNDTDPVAPDSVLLAQGLAKVTGLAPLDDTHQWDPATKTVIVVVAVTRRQITVFEWINRFTATELAGIRASTNNGVQKFLFMLPLAVGQSIDMNSDTVTSVMTLLVSQALLTQARANTIMA